MLTRGLIVAVVVAGLVTGCSTPPEEPPAAVFSSLSCAGAVGGQNVAPGQLAENLYPLPDGVVPPDFDPSSVIWCSWNRETHETVRRGTTDLSMLHELVMVPPDWPDPEECPSSDVIATAILVGSYDDQWMSLAVPRRCGDPLPEVMEILRNHAWD